MIKSTYFLLYLIYIIIFLYSILHQLNQYYIIMIVYFKI